MAAEQFGLRRLQVLQQRENALPRLEGTIQMRQRSRCQG